MQILPASTKTVHTLLRCSSQAVFSGYSLDDICLNRSCAWQRHRHTTAALDDSALHDDCPMIRNSRGHLKSFDEMPGPKGWPFVGTLYQYIKKDGLKFSKMFEVMTLRANEYGPVYKERIATNQSVVVSDPFEYAKVIKVDGKYPHRVELAPMAFYKKKRGYILGLVNDQGPEWFRHRKVLSKVMLKPKEVHEYATRQSDVGTDFIRHMSVILPNDGYLRNFEQEVFKWALESICVVLFEERIGCFPNPPTERAQQFIYHLICFFQLMQPLMYNWPVYKIYPTPTWRQFEKHADAVVGIGLDMVKKKVELLRRQLEQGLMPGEKESKSEFLTYLLAQKSLSPEEANCHAVDLMMGAVETTANAFMWTLYCLSNFPDAQRQLQEEIDQVVPADGRIDAEVLSKMSYTKACLKETFRLYPITFATSRIISEDIELGGFHVPKGSHCQANLYGMGRDPALFPDPLTYKPERWLRDGDGSGVVNPQATLPFGHGARMCIGRRFAEQEIYIGLAKLMQNFSVSHEGILEPVLHTVMTPDRPVHFRFTKRPQRNITAEAEELVNFA